jgi:hypothetical protein
LREDDQQASDEGRRGISQDAGLRRAAAFAGALRLLWHLRLPLDRRSSKETDVETMPV